jgi:hypothetical protein
MAFPSSSLPFLLDTGTLDFGFGTYGESVLAARPLAR